MQRLRKRLFYAASVLSTFIIVVAAVAEIWRFWIFGGESALSYPTMIAVLGMGGYTGAIYAIARIKGGAEYDRDNMP